MPLERHPIHGLDTEAWFYPFPSFYFTVRGLAIGDLMRRVGGEWLVHQVSVEPLAVFAVYDLAIEGFAADVPPDMAAQLGPRVQSEFARCGVRDGFQSWGWWTRHVYAGAISLEEAQLLAMIWADLYGRPGWAETLFRAAEDSCSMQRATDAWGADWKQQLDREMPNRRRQRAR